MGLPALVGAASSFGGLFQGGGPQDAFKSSPRDAGLTLVQRADPVVWRNQTQRTIRVSDRVTSYEVPPGGVIYQSPGGKPDSGRLTPGGGGTRAAVTADAPQSQGTPPGSIESQGRPGDQPVNQRIRESAAVGTSTLVIGLLILLAMTSSNK